MFLLLPLLALAGSDFGQVRPVLTWDTTYSVSDWIPVLQDTAGGQLGNTPVRVKCGTPEGKKTCAIVTADGAEYTRSTDVSVASDEATVVFRPGGKDLAGVKYETITLTLRRSSPTR